MNKIINLVIVITTVVVVPVTSAQDLTPKEMQCKAPTFSVENIVSIVKRERSINLNLPREIEDGVVSVNRKRCHYVYTETSRPGSIAYRSKAVTITEFGSVVDFIDGRVKKSSAPCPNVEYTEEQIATFLQESRKRFTDLPQQPKAYNARVSKMRCFYVYYEIPKSEDDGKGYSFTFDYYGDLFDFSPLEYR